MRSAIPALVAVDSPLVAVQEALSDADVQAGRVEGFNSSGDMMRAIWAEWNRRHAVATEPAAGCAENEESAD